ncbi:hypothetical protein [Abyssisolibacter fermentans]|uniref:hypothetical protein n=1 Tax=Abyssisolibacter fermentans TaxID=1766203 RepID=UPI0008351E7E|nr:hypothetical protein [Abyssisolibacter fermentans]
MKKQRSDGVEKVLILLIGMYGNSIFPEIQNFLSSCNPILFNMIFTILCYGLYKFIVENINTHLN